MLEAASLLIVALAAVFAAHLYYAWRLTRHWDRPQPRRAAVAFSRPPSSHPLGKLIAERKTVLPECIDAQLVMLASLAGQTPSEYLRDLVVEQVIGRATVVRLQAGRQQGRPVSWPESGAE